MGPIDSLPGFVRLVFQRGNDIGAALIRWHSRSPWNHVCIWDPQTMTMWEARQSTGVRRYDHWWPSPKDRVARFAQPLDEHQRRRMVDWLNHQIGKGYDWGAVLRFVSRRKVNPAESSRRWFCSELAAAAWTMATGGMLLRLPSWKISPGLLYASPLVIPEPMFRPA